MGADLSELEVWILDCQATGASPRTGQLLEVAWCRATAAGGPVGPLQSRLVALRADGSLPARVSRLTGIENAHLVGAPDEQALYLELLSGIGSSTAPMLAHYARFEESFLHDLHQRFSPERPCSWRFICTHEIARRLLPELPRRSLRALAGHFGHALPERKRAADHVVGTLIVWQNLVQKLRLENDIRDLDGLRHWLSRRWSRTRTRRAFSLPREQRLELPRTPGVYRFVDRTGRVLYVGKATNLRNRVNSYFRRQSGGAEHILEMLSQAVDVDTTEAATPLEAALLEVDEIKRLDPPYNVALRDMGREIWFFDPELASARPLGNDRHPIGPIPERQTLDACAQLARCLLQDSVPNDEDVVLHLFSGIPRDRLPASANLSEGWSMLRGNIGSMPQPPLARWVFIVGGRLHFAARLRSEQEAVVTTDSNTDEDAAPGVRQWDGPAVADWLQALLSRGAAHMRRARWLSWLSESRLSFADGSNHRRLLALDAGRVGAGGDLPAGAELDVPAGAERTIRDRLLAFDRAMFDRLRVLTTELKRLVSGGAQVSIRLTDEIQLDTRGLARLLRWL